MYFQAVDDCWRRCRPHHHRGCTDCAIAVPGGKPPPRARKTYVREIPRRHRPAGRPQYPHPAPGQALVANLPRRPAWRLVSAGAEVREGQEPHGGRSTLPHRGDPGGLPADAVRGCRGCRRTGWRLPAGIAGAAAAPEAGAGVLPYRGPRHAPRPDRAGAADRRAAPAAGGGTGHHAVASAWFAASRIALRFIRATVRPASVEQLVDVVLGDALAVELRAVEQELPLALGAVALAVVEEAFEIALVHDVGEARDPRLDVLERLHHLGDALAGDVLERAGLEDDHHLLVDQRLVGDRVAGIGGHHGLGTFHDRVGRLLGRLDDGAKLLAGQRDAAVLEVVALQHPDLLPHRLDVLRELAQLAIDPGVHGMKEALQRLGRDFRQLDDVVKRDVVALLAQKVDQAVEMAGFHPWHRASPVQAPVIDGPAPPCAVRTFLILRGLLSARRRTRGPPRRLTRRTPPR